MSQTPEQTVAILWRLCAETRYSDHEAREALTLASVAVEGGGDPSVSSSSDVLPNSARNLAEPFDLEAAVLSLPGILFCDTRESSSGFGRYHAPTIV